MQTLAGLNGLHLLDFWTNICVCHSLIVETDSVTGLKSVQVNRGSYVYLLLCLGGFRCVGSRCNDFVGRGVEEESGEQDARGDLGN